MGIGFIHDQHRKYVWPEFHISRDCISSYLIGYFGPHIFDICVVFSRFKIADIVR